MRALSPRSAPRLALALLGLSLAAPARADDGWVGRRVITKFGATLQVDGKIVDDETRVANSRGGEHRDVRVYRVTHVDGPWLWLEDEDGAAAGWVTTEWVIPHDQAIDHFTAEIRANPKNASAYNNPGLIWYQRKDYDLAIADHGDAIRIDPSNEPAWLNRGNALAAKGERDRAVAAYNEAIRLDPRYASAYYNRGVIFASKGDYDRAVADYNEAIRLDPKDASAYFNRATTHLIQSKGEAIGGYRRVLGLREWKGKLPAYAVILGNLAARRAGDEARRGRSWTTRGGSSTRRHGRTPPSATCGARSTSRPSWPSPRTTKRGPRPEPSSASTWP